MKFRSKDGAPIVPNTRRRLKVRGNVVQLALENVQKEDAGMYTVTAKSPTGTSSRDMELRIGDQHNNATASGGNDDEPPAFLRRLNDLSVKVGTRTRFLVEIRSSTELMVRQIYATCSNFFFKIAI